MCMCQSLTRAVLPWLQVKRFVVDKVTGTLASSFSMCMIGAHGHMIWSHDIRIQSHDCRVDYGHVFSDTRFP